MEGSNIDLQIDEECASSHVHNEPSEPIHQSNNSTAKPFDQRSIPLVELSLENITYAPSTRTSKSKSRRQILSNVSTIISPHKLNAWMGPSGSGKTSLLSVAAGVLSDPNNDLISNSCIRINGEKGSLPKSLVGVVWQEDLLLPNLTVRETVRFAARLKTPRSLSEEDVDQLVDETLSQLGLTNVRDSLIGSPTGGLRGISGGERKRVAVAVELVARPSVLLLDEPTSGLDSSTALQLIATLKELAALGHAIAVVIHQPRTSIFDLFDNLLLLEKGRVVYEGPCSEVKNYLESCPNLEKLPPETGKADWLMDLITSDENREGGGVLPSLWETRRSECTNLPQAIPKKLNRKLSSIAELKQEQPKFHAGFFTQLKLLTVRASKQQRGERITRVGIFLMLCYVAFSSLAWGRMPDTTSYIYNRASLLYFIIIAQANSIVTSSMVAFSSERRLLSRERAKKMYGVLSYFLAKTLADMVNSVALPVCYGMAVYWICGYRAMAEAFFTFILILYLTLSASQSTGLFLSIAINNMTIALMLAPFLTLCLMILGGFYIPYDSIHPALSWASWLSMARYGFSAFLINEFDGREIQCDDDDPSNSAFHAEQCPLPGSEVISYFGIEGAWRSVWLNVAMLIAIQVCLRVATYFLLLRAQ